MKKGLHASGRIIPKCHPRKGVAFPQDVVDVFPGSLVMAGWWTWPQGKDEAGIIHLRTALLPARHAFCFAREPFKGAGQQAETLADAQRFGFAACGFTKPCKRRQKQLARTGHIHHADTGTGDGSLSFVRVSESFP